MLYRFGRAPAKAAPDALSPRAMGHARARRFFSYYRPHLPTVRHADRILVLTEEGLAEEGTHDELINRGGAYAPSAACRRAFERLSSPRAHPARGEIMRRIGLAVLAAAVLGVGPAALAQSETELYEAGANAMAGAQREVTQRNIDLANQALRAKDYAKARKYAQPVTRADPKRVDSWLLLGAAQQGLGDWQGARKTYTTAVRISPNHPEARAGLGLAYAHTNDPKATAQLAWLTAQVAECDGCWRASQLAHLKSALEGAIAASKPPS
jgi:tetratricopeptide (TPR) repeat protein